MAIPISTRLPIVSSSSSGMTTVPMSMMRKYMASGLLGVATLVCWMVLLLSYAVLFSTALTAGIALAWGVISSVTTTPFVRWLAVWAIVFGLSGFAVIILESELQYREFQSRP